MFGAQNISLFKQLHENSKYFCTDLNNFINYVIFGLC